MCRELRAFLESPIFQFYLVEMTMDLATFDQAISESPKDIATILQREKLFGERQRHLAFVEYFPRLLLDLETNIVPSLQTKEDEKNNV